MNSLDTRGVTKAHFPTAKGWAKGTRVWILHIHRACRAFESTIRIQFHDPNYLQIEP